MSRTYELTEDELLLIREALVGKAKVLSGLSQELFKYADLTKPGTEKLSNELNARSKVLLALSRRFF